MRIRLHMVSVLKIKWGRNLECWFRCIITTKNIFDCTSHFLKHTLPAIAVGRWWCLYLKCNFISVKSANVMPAFCNCTTYRFGHCSWSKFSTNKTKKIILKNVPKKSSTLGSCTIALNTEYNAAFREQCDHLKYLAESSSEEATACPKSEILDFLLGSWERPSTSGGTKARKLTSTTLESCSLSIYKATKANITPYTISK